MGAEIFYRKNSRTVLQNSIIPSLKKASRSLWDIDSESALTHRSLIHTTYATDPSLMGSPMAFLLSCNNFIDAPSFHAETSVKCDSCSTEYPIFIKSTKFPVTKQQDLELINTVPYTVDCPTYDCKNHKLPFKLAYGEITCFNVPGNLISKTLRKSLQKSIMAKNFPINLLHPSILRLASSFPLDEPVMIGTTRSAISEIDGVRHIAAVPENLVYSSIFQPGLFLDNVSLSIIPRKHLSVLTKNYMPSFNINDLRNLILQNHQYVVEPSSILSDSTESDDVINASPTKTEFLPVKFDPDTNSFTFANFGVIITVPVRLFLSDFAYAQLNGHILALARLIQLQIPCLAFEIYKRPTRNFDASSLDIAIYLFVSLFKGCGYHLKLNMVSFAKSLNIDLREQFLRDIDTLRHTTMPLPKFILFSKTMITNYPAFAPIFSWWSHSFMGKMAFASLSSLVTNFEENENTDNPIESSFRLLRLLGFRKMSLGSGLATLALSFDFAQIHMENPDIPYQYGRKSKSFALLPKDLSNPNHTQKRETQRKVVLHWENDVELLSGIPTEAESSQPTITETASPSVRQKRRSHFRAYCRCSNTGKLCVNNRCSCRRMGNACGTNCTCCRLGQCANHLLLDHSG